MKKRYSKRLGKISNKQIQKALSKFDLGELVSTSKVEEGLFGQNFFVKSDRGEYVFRGTPHYNWQFPKEKFFVNKLHKKTNALYPTHIC